MQFASDRKLVIALAGNPNSGKTTVFNALTGGRQHVGNYPGVTVAIKVGRARHENLLVEVVDLPGTYSLTAYSAEEVVARNFILDRSPDVVIDIIDSANLERNLYLATQLMHLRAPLVLAFNMSDLADARGYRINHAKLSELLGVPIVRTVAHKGRGTEDLLEQAVRTAREGPAAVSRQTVPHFGRELEPEIEKLSALAADKCRQGGRGRWIAIKLLEDDAEAIRRLRSLMPAQEMEELLAAAGQSRRHIESVCGDSAEIILADRRYGFISGACTEAVTHTVEARHALSDTIDRVLTNRYLGLPIFAAMMYLVFQMTFWLGNPLVDLLDGWKDGLAAAVHRLDGSGGSVLVSLLADGLIEGVGAVLVFVPLIVLLFLAIALLEDSGYMARAAFVLDRLMHKIGLHGKSFVPMLLGFGCTVPAIMATRTLETRRDRLTTMLVLPLMSCGARLPVYVLILGAFFPSRPVLRLIRVGLDDAHQPVYLLNLTNQALLLFAIYLIGIVLALASIKLLRATLFRGEVTPFVMELPPYRLPTARGLLVHLWEPTWMYMRKAGTIILAIVVIMWALKTWPALPAERQREIARQALAQGRPGDVAVHQVRLRHSAIGQIGHAIAPLLRPCGFDWKVSTALLGAFAAKEVFVGQMGVIYAVGENADAHSDSLRQQLAADYSPLQGFCIMLFILIASPCMATVAVTVRESGSWKWAVLQWGYLTALAWTLATAVFQIGRAAGLGAGGGF